MKRLSFFFHLLIIQFHDTPDSKSEQSKEKTGVPVKPHSSRVTSVSACNCGRTQGSREDPFDLKVSFYLLFRTSVRTLDQSQQQRLQNKVNGCCSSISFVDFEHLITPPDICWQIPI